MVDVAASAPAAASPPNARAQLAAIARLRWQILRNSLRTMRGRLEAVSWAFIALWFAALGLGGAIGIAAGSWFILSHGYANWLGALFWPIFTFWIFFPLVATAFTEVFDSTNLLRYPLRYSSFFLVNLVYGSLDGSTIVGILWLLGAAVGAALAAPVLAPWIVFAIALFGAANVFLVRALFAWIERWLAQRRTREIMGIIFFLAIISFQMIGPLANHLRSRRFEVPAYVTQAITVQKFLPPGLAADAVSGALRSDWRLAAGSLLLLSCYAAGFGLLFHLRLRGQYSGESFGEGVPRVRPAAAREQRATARSGWDLPGLSGQVTATMEKEAHYLSRSAPMLFALIMPAVVLLLFHFGGNPDRPGGRIAHNPNLAFPIGAAYSLLLLTNMVYNNFGADGTGVQFFFVAPVRMRSIVLAKNLVHCGVLALEMAVVWIATYLLFGSPASDVVAATLTGILFAAPINFCAGNLLSLYTPKKYDYAAFGRQRAPGLTVLASFGVQGFTIGVAVLVILVSRRYGNLWPAAAIFAGLAAISLGLYRALLARIDGIAALKRESLIATVAKAG